MILRDIDGTRVTNEIKDWIIEPNSLNFKISKSLRFLEIKILDKVSSKNTSLILKIGEEKRFQNLIIKSLKCKNSEFE